MISLITPFQSIINRVALTLLLQVFLLCGGEDLSCSVTSPDGEHPDECMAAPAPDLPKPGPYFPRSLVSWGDNECADQDADECTMRAFLGDCAKRPNVFLEKCPFSCALCNNHQDRKVRICYGKDQTANEKETLEIIRETQNYMIRQVFVEEKFKSVRNIVR
jgi:hypothetical protein